MPNIREMRFDDYAAVMAVLRRNGLATRSREDWLHPWAANPFHSPLAPIGWLIEDAEHRVVGTFANLHLAYEWNRRPVRVGAAFAWAVDPAYRRQAIGLFRRWTAQPGLDLLLTSTASERVGQIFSAARFRPVPHADYDKTLYWVTNRRGFAVSALRHLGAPLPDWLSYPAAAALGTLGRMRAQRARREQLPAPERLTDFDERFDAFWDRLRATPDRLLAVRSLAALRWHFKRAHDSAERVILALTDRDELSGYLVMIRQDHDAIGLTRYRVADLQVLDDSQAAVRALLLGALARAAGEGVHVVEVVGLSARKREALAPLLPLKRRMPSWLFYYRAAEAGLASALAVAAAWDPSPFDGDASL